MRPAQQSMREARSRNKPLLPWFVLAVVVLAAAVAALVLYRAREVHTYGIVRAETQELRAPFPGEIRELAVRPGDRVEKGDLILVLASTAASPEELAAQKALQESLEQRAETLAEDAATRRTQEIRAAQAEIARLTAAAREVEAERRYEVEQARLEVEKLERIHQSRKERFEKVKALQEMDAAVASDVESARTAMEEAEYNLRQAEVTLSLAQAKANPVGRKLDEAQARLEAIEGEADQTDFLLEKARAELALAEQKYSDSEIAVEQGKLAVSIAQTGSRAVEYRALFDGLVTQVATAEGSVVTPEELLLTVADTRREWVDVYVPPEDIGVIEQGRDVLLYVPGIDRPLQGTISSGGGTVVNTPQLLYDYRPRMKRSIYTRVDLAEAEMLLPGNIIRVVIPRS